MSSIFWALYDTMNIITLIHSTTFTKTVGMGKKGIGLQFRYITFIWMQISKKHDQEGCIVYVFTKVDANPPSTLRATSVGGRMDSNMDSDCVMDSQNRVNVIVGKSV